MRTFENVEQIKAERQAQRNNPVIYSLLGVVLGELDRLPTREKPTKDQIYTVIKKMHESAQLMSSIESRAEAEYFEDFIKKQLSHSEIEIIIADFILQQPNTNIGIVMKHFKDNYSGQYDGKLVSQIAKEMLC